MNDCIEPETQDRLPDVLHGRVGAGDKARIDAHVAQCASCRQELEVLRAVQSAAVFSPAIDVQAIVRQIPPYRMPVPAGERPVRSPVMRWLAVAAVALVAVGGGSVMLRESTAEQPVAATLQNTHRIALASGIDELSDDGVVQLMTELNSFDALPSSDPEPVFAIDNELRNSGDSL